MQFRSDGVVLARLWIGDLPNDAAVIGQPTPSRTAFVPSKGYMVRSGLPGLSE